MTTADLNQIKHIIEEVTSPQFTKLNHHINQVRKNLKQYIVDVDKKVSYVDQRLSKIEFKLGLPTPKFNPTKPVTSVFINPIES